MGGLVAAGAALGGTDLVLGPDRGEAGSPTVQARVAPSSGAVPSSPMPFSAVPTESTNPASPADRPDTADSMGRATATEATPTDSGEAESPSSTASRSPGAHLSASPGAADFSGPGGDAAEARSGRGRIWHYTVEVEDGIGLDADDVADEVGRILADPRGWTADGRNGFARVASGHPREFAVKIGTPATVKQLCAKGGVVVTHDVNCRVGDDVVVSLTRWTQGSPQFKGPIGDYRALIINHEVGHRLGHGHETCPGKGRSAPAMMQQIYGLKGCMANAWPYDRDGRYIGGPAVA